VKRIENTIKIKFLVFGFFTLAFVILLSVQIILQIRYYDSLSFRFKVIGLMCAVFCVVFLFFACRFVRLFSQIFLFKYSGQKELYLEQLKDAPLITTYLAFRYSNSADVNQIIVNEMKRRKLARENDPLVNSSPFILESGYSTNEKDMIFIAHHFICVYSNKRALVEKVIYERDIERIETIKGPDKIPAVANNARLFGAMGLSRYIVNSLIEYNSGERAIHLIVHYKTKRKNEQIVIYSKDIQEWIDSFLDLGHKIFQMYDA
jgi:hypothetical protein